MSHIAQIKQGATAARYRAYSVGPATRKPTVADHRAMAKAGKEFKPGQRVSYQAEHVVKEGVIEGFEITVVSADDVITKVVFYSGPPEAEEVVGSLEVGAAGVFEIALVEEPKDEPEPIPESELGQ